MTANNGLLGDVNERIDAALHSMEQMALLDAQLCERIAKLEEKTAGLLRQEGLVEVIVDHSAKLADALHRIAVLELGLAKLRARIGAIDPGTKVLGGRKRR